MLLGWLGYGVELQVCGGRILLPLLCTYGSDYRPPFAFARHTKITSFPHAKSASSQVKFREAVVARIIHVVPAGEQPTQVALPPTFRGITQMEPFQLEVRVRGADCSTPSSATRVFYSSHAPPLIRDIFGACAGWGT